MAFRERVAQSIFEFMSNETHETILAVSHGATCRQFMRYWAHTSEGDQKNPLGNCCVLKFEFDENEFRLIEIINHDFKLPITNYRNRKERSKYKWQKLKLENSSK